MTFKVHCTCGQKVSATDDMIGTTAICPRCGSGIVVQLPPELAATAASAAPPKLPPQLASVRAVPMAVVPRPVGLLALAAAVALVLLFSTAAFLFRAHLHELVPYNLPVLIGLPIGLAGGSAILAIFLRLAVRIVVRFDLAFLEAWLLALMISAVNALAVIPAALVPFHMLPPEQGGKLLVLTLGGGLLITIVTYSFLIRNAVGRPIGIGRGILTYLLQTVFVALLAGIIAVIGTLVGTFFLHRLK
jgi:DNA-directed RNA polymerase subunit RPC12/RpoP